MIETTIQAVIDRLEQTDNTVHRLQTFIDMVNDHLTHLRDTAATRQDAAWYASQAEETLRIVRTIKQELDNIDVYARTAKH